MRSMLVDEEETIRTFSDNVRAPYLANYAQGRQALGRRGWKRLSIVAATCSRLAPARQRSLCKGPKAI